VSNHLNPEGEWIEAVRQPLSRRITGKRVTGSAVMVKDS
jgi:hypothetical protein